MATTTELPTTTTMPPEVATTTPEPVGHFGGYPRMIPMILTDELMDEMFDSGIIPVL